MNKNLDESCFNTAVGRQLVLSVLCFYRYAAALLEDPIVFWCLVWEYVQVRATQMLPKTSSKMLG